MSMLTVGMSDEWFKKEGMRRDPEPWEDGTRVDNLPGRFEWWYFDAHLDDGTIVVATIFSKPYTNIQLPCSPQVKLSITDPGGTTYTDIDDFTAEDFHAAKETCDVKVGKSWMKGDLAKYVIHMEVQGKTVDLEFTRDVPSWRPGIGKCFFGEDLHDYFGWIVPVPYGRVSGKVAYNGKERSVKGSGYHDHNYGNIALTKIIDHWYWGRLKIADYNCIFFQFVATKKYGSGKLPLFMFARGDKLLTGDGSKLAVSEKDMIRHETGKLYPGILNFNWKDGSDSIVITLSNPDLIDARNLLAGFPWLKRTIARLIVNPYYFRFNAETEIRIDFKGIRDSRKEKAIYECMMLK
jgi:hypothetical protein